MSTLILEEGGSLVMTGDASITINGIPLKDLHTREDMDLIVLCAFRYALGRRSYIVSTVADFITNNIDLVPKNFRDLMVDEITMGENNEYFYSLGDDCDKVTWLKLRDFLKKQ